MSASIQWQPRGRLTDPARWRPIAPRSRDPPDLQGHDAGNAVRSENLVAGAEICATCADVPWAPSARSRVRYAAGRPQPASPGERRSSACGLETDLLDCYPCRVTAGFAASESWRKDAEILMLRHQLVVAEREHPRAHSRLTWPDRAWLTLLAGTLPIGRLAVMRLIVTPGTIPRWHRDIVRRRGRASRAREGPAGRRRAATSGRRC